MHWVVLAPYNAGSSSFRHLIYRAFYLKEKVKRILSKYITELPLLSTEEHRIVVIVGYLSYAVVYRHFGHWQT